MATHTYTGSLVALDDTVYWIQIANTESTESGNTELIFPADEPVMIEWDEQDKLAPVQGSMLTLKVESMSDRQFIDLYTTTAGAVVITVKRDGALYWRGWLDPEQYEEPYSTEANYDVTLTFSDFGVLERKGWNAVNKHMTIMGIIKHCLSSCGFSELQQSMSTVCTTLTSEQSYDPLNYLMVDTNNFYDEDGEAMTMREVLEAVLQPFGLRIIQKAGQLYLHDLNALYNTMAKAIVWDSDDQTLGVDSVYNHVKVTLSPYVQEKLIDGSIDYDDVKLTAANVSKSGIWRVAAANDGTNGFKVELADNSASYNANLTTAGKIFKITSIYDGTEDVGVACAIRSNSYYNNKGLTDVFYSVDGSTTGKFLDRELDGSCNHTALLTVKGGYISRYGDYECSTMLRVKLSMLLSPLYNPFEDCDEYNHKAVMDYIKKKHQFYYVRCRLVLKDQDGKVICHYRNADIFDSNNIKYAKPTVICGRWVDGDCGFDEMYLAYYDWSDRSKGSTPISSGWITNKQAVGNEYTADFTAAVKGRGDGQFINVPYASGWLELQVAAGVDDRVASKDDSDDANERYRWLLFKDPEVSLVRSNGSDLTDTETGDVVESAYLDANAKDDYDLDLTVGAGSVFLPTARGQLRQTDNNTLPLFRRGDYSSTLERLLIGTIYSQYATRHAVLSGTAQLLPSFTPVSDDAMDGTKFILLSEIQSLRECTSEIKASELTPEEYEGIVYE
jgi:hypothetical protein